jgi:hypothetical protein
MGNGDLQLELTPEPWFHPEPTRRFGSDVSQQRQQRRPFDRERAIADFLEHWTPDRILQEWIDEIGSLGIDPAGVVRQVSIYHPPYAGERLVSFSWGRRIVAWWKKQDVEPRRRHIQEHVATKSDKVGIPEHYIRDVNSLTGPRQTIEYLLRAENDASQVGAVLLSASLFNRAESSRGQYPREEWPHVAIARELLRWLRSKQECHWESSCTATLPFHESEYGTSVTNAWAWIRFLAVEHARVLHNWTPIELVFTDQLDPWTKRIIDDAREAHRQSEAESQQTLLAIEKQRMEEDRWHSASDAQRMILDPQRAKRERWPKVTKAELERLIWSRPTSEIAADFGVSDVSVSKRCKALGIKKPVRGYWQRLRAEDSSAHERSNPDTEEPIK